MATSSVAVATARRPKAKRRLKDRVDPGGRRKEPGEALQVDEARLAQTAVFLDQLQTAVRHLAWLNPMPQTRWAGSSAGFIARQVAMFETTRIGLQGAIKALRGARPHAQERYQP